MKFVFDRNPDKVKELALAKINSFLKENSSRKIIFLSSGGSCLELINGIDKENFNPNLTFTLIDERFTFNNSENNYQKLISNKEFLAKVEDSNANILNTSILANENPKEFSRRYEKIIKNYFKINPNSLAFITFGVGEDAHTIGIKPNKENIFNKLFVNTNRYFIDYKVLDPNFSHRITATFKLIKEKMSFGIVYQVKKDFGKIWHEIEANNFKLNEKPSGIFYNLENIEIFTDSY